jgi:hypothetical protein
MNEFAFQVDDADVTGTPGVSHADTRHFQADATGANVIDLPGVLDRYGRRPKKYPIWDVTVDGQPFEVTVSRSGTGWFAENDAYNVAGHGESISAALQDALDGVRYLAAQLLTESDDALSERARVLKQRYALIQIR